MRKSHHTLLLFLIISFAAIIRTLCGDGLFYPDAYAYVTAALRIHIHGWAPFFNNIPDIYANRFAIVWPMGLFIEIFGPHRWAVLAPGLIASLMTIITVYYIGKNLRDRQSGFLAALILASTPYDVFLSTATLPDTYLPLYTAAIMLCLLKAKCPSADARRSIAFLAGAGLFVFMSFETRGFGPIILAATGIYSLSTPRRKWQGALIPGIVFAGLVLFLWGILSYTGIGFFGQLEKLRNDANALSGEEFSMDYAAAMFTPLRFLPFANPGIPQPSDPQWVNILYEFAHPYFGVIGALVFPAAFFASFRLRKDKTYLMPLLVFLIFYVYLEFGFTSLAPYNAIWKRDRFLTIFFPAAALLIAFSICDLANLFSKRRRIYVIWSAVLMTIGINAGCIAARYEVWGYLVNNDVFSEICKQIKSIDPQQPINTLDGRWKMRGVVEMRLAPQFDPEFAKINADAKPDEIYGWVIWDTSLFTRYGERKLNIENYDTALQTIPHTLPENWTIQGEFLRKDRNRHHAFPVYLILAGEDY